MAKHTLTYPDPTPEGEEFVFAIDGRTIELPPFADVITSFAFERRLIAAGEKRGTLTDAAVATAFTLAAEDDEEVLRLIDYLSNAQTLEMLDKWAKHKGVSAPEA